VKFVGLFAYYHGMACVIATLISHYDVGVFGEQVGYFGLTLISKLCSHNNYVSQGLISN